MMNPFSFENVVLKVLMMLVLLMATTSNAATVDDHDDRTHVQITNNLGSNMTLSILCRSNKGEYLGNQRIVPNRSYEISFHPSFNGTKSFFCRFLWHGARTRFFVIYRMDRDQSRCNLQCLWSIKTEAICLFNKHTNKYDICFPWTS
jgi:hypothetical protein